MVLVSAKRDQRLQRDGCVDKLPRLKWPTPVVSHVGEAITPISASVQVWSDSVADQVVLIQEDRKRCCNKAERVGTLITVWKNRQWPVARGPYMICLCLIFSNL